MHQRRLAHLRQRDRADAPSSWRRPSTRSGTPSSYRGKARAPAQAVAAGVMARSVRAGHKHDAKAVYGLAPSAFRQANSLSTFHIYVESMFDVKYLSISK